MKRFVSRAAGTVLALLMVWSLLAVPNAGMTASAVYYRPGSVITFGSYPQTRVTNVDVVALLEERSLTFGGEFNYCGARYKRVCFTQYTPYNSRLEPKAENSYQDDNGYFANRVYWFKVEPVQWRVLSNINGDLFLVSTKILDAQPYYAKYDKSTWETSTMRAWLNGSFYKTAFSLLESRRILTSTVVNEDNPFYGTEGGNDTKDRVFLLSFRDVMKITALTDSGLASSDDARAAAVTDYAKCMGVRAESAAGAFYGCGEWWLRSPGRDNTRAGYVYYIGIDMFGAPYVGADVDTNCLGVRPALKLRGLTILCSTDNPGFVADSVNGLIWGLEPGTLKTFFESAVDMGADIRIEYSTDNASLGTGVEVSLIDTATGGVLETYRIVVFGDVNGDANIDSGDAGLIVDFENFIVTWDPFADAAFYKAADLNGDGNVDAADAGLIIDAENYLLAIDQATGLAG
ncbi:MAG TPA: DUF6273 domain-containing protein [Clostridiales bacterium]|nr:MAG: hypothetical protein BWY37_01970 [Firmicutes bacterium ADurb.Bin262]HOU09310.1 DUF6273 domain-containing protein [Clostridiales bacterium]HQK73934.1 DUF6273 domain-containing protein [Clostridiales bacterium]